MTNDLKIRFLNRGAIEQKDRLRAELDSQVAEFLAAGGRATEVPAGATAGWKAITTPINAISHDDVGSILKSLPAWRFKRGSNTVLRHIHHEGGFWCAKWKGKYIGKYQAYADAVVAQSEWLEKNGVAEDDK